MPIVYVSQFGAFRYGEGVRYNEASEQDSSGAVAFAEGRYGLSIIVYEPFLGVKKAVYSSDQGQCPVASASFSFEESGCAAFKLAFNSGPGDIAIRRGDRVDIHLFGAVLPWFSGRVTAIPGVNTSPAVTEFSGHGFFDVLDSIVVTETYTGQTIENMVLDLAETYLAGQDIAFYPDQLPVTGYTASSVQFDRVSLKEALGKLADLAQDYVFGVDENRTFYFLPRSGVPIGTYVNKTSHWVGRHLAAFTLSEKSGDIANRLWVKIGAVSSGSNFADFVVEDLDSIAFFGERGKVLSAPELKNEADALTWAEYQLSTMAWPQISGKAKGLDLAGWVTGKADLIRAEGALRVSLLRSGVLPPYHEPLAGYFRGLEYGRAPVYGANWIKREFTPRKSGKLGPVELMLRKIGSPGDLVVRLKAGATVLATITVEAETIPEWYGWVRADMGGVTVYAAGTYTLEIYEGSGNSSNYYDVLYSGYDAPFSGGFYSSINSGSSWTEDTDRGLIFRACLVHEDEFILPIKKVSYSATPSGGISADIEVGELDRPLEKRFIELLRSMRAEEILAQSNVSDLS